MFCQIPYTMSSNLGLGDRLTVAKAMLEIELKTCVQFVLREHQFNYIEISRSVKYRHSLD